MMKSLPVVFRRCSLMAASGIAVCAVALCAMAGCGAPNGATPGGSDSVLRSAARAALIGRFYDRALWAAERGNIAAFRAAHGELLRLGAMSEALSLAFNPMEEAVIRGLRFDSFAQQVEGAARNELQARAAQQYRLALRLSPQFDSIDPLKLNTLGYFLAERGTTAQDFTEAERLTRASLRLLDEAIAQEEKRGGDTSRMMEMRANVRDSVAWALFRQRHFDEALREQQRAVQEANDSAAKGVSVVHAELYFHLGEILRALGRMSEARAQYEAALKIDPAHAASRRALRSIGPQQSEPPPKIFNPAAKSI